jgi:hypothetical protein
MKLFKFLSHPYTLIICFLAIMISGENFGGFYAMYILMALPFGGVHALLAFAGIIVLLGNHSIKRNKVNAAWQVINMLGVLLLFASLYYFFWADKQHYNYGSFEQPVPILTMAVTALAAACFLISNFIKARAKTLLVV